MQQGSIPTGMIFVTTSNKLLGTFRIVNRDASGQ